MLFKKLDWRICLLSIGIVSCQDEQEVSQKEVFPVTRPIVIDTNSHVDYVAEIVGVKNIEIRSMIPGYLARVHVDEGQVVKEGQVLFSINSASYKEEVVKSQALLKIAEAEVESASLTVQNTRELVKKNVISNIELEFAKNKLQIAKAKVDEAKANVAHAKWMLYNTEIRAPFPGIINRLPQKIGSLVEEGSLLTTLSQNNEIFAYFDVSEPDYLNFMSKITKGSQQEKEVELILADGKKFAHKGHIETVDGEIDPNSGNISVRSRFKNPDFILKHGASGKLRIPKKFQQVMVIPQKATFDIQDRTFVYVVTKDNKLRMRAIEVGNRLPHLYIVTKGLSTSDRILYEGIQLAEEGMQIETKMISPKSIIQKLSKQ